ncbi:MAG: response regulator transcription factor [Firmicutes bacterium]|nr:response regulator transcription factor [Bacillota bacterium]
MRVVIVDDHEVVRVGLAAVLRDEPGIDVVAMVGTAAAAVEAAARYHPDVLVLDLRLPDRPGTAAVEEIRAVSPNTRILVLTSYGEDRAVLASVRAGVDGFLTKTTDSAALVEAVRALAAGRSLLRDQVADVLVRLVQTGGTEHRRPPARRGLTPREWEVAEAVADGLSNREIAERLHLSEKTVKHHVSEVLDKLGLSRRSQIAGVLRDASSRDEEEW